MYTLGSGLINLTALITAPLKSVLHDHRTFIDKFNNTRHRCSIKHCHNHFY